MRLRHHHLPAAPADDERGETLIELIVAVAIIGLGVVAATASATTSSSSLPAASKGS